MTSGDHADTERDRAEDERPPASSLVAWLWGAVLLELVSPVPALLTLGGIYVLAAKPAWFRRAVDELYGDPPAESRRR